MILTDIVRHLRTFADKNYCLYSWQDFRFGRFLTASLDATGMTPLHCRAFIHSPAVRSPAILPLRPKFHGIATVGPPRGTGRIPVHFDLNRCPFIPFSGRPLSTTSPLDNIGLYSENPTKFQIKRLRNSLFYLPSPSKNRSESFSDITFPVIALMSNSLSNPFAHRFANSLRYIECYIECYYLTNPFAHYLFYIECYIECYYPTNPFAHYLY